MKLVSENALIRARHALHWANHFYPAVIDRDEQLSQTVRRLVLPQTVGLPSQPATAFPVTVQGMVTMAIVPQQAQRHGTALLVPGVDDTGRAGYLLIETGPYPYAAQTTGAFTITIKVCLETDLQAELPCELGELIAGNSAQLPAGRLAA
ncbi:MAG: hypothetical protein ACRBC3_15950 [Burkholderiaceae bacterium]